MHDARWTCCRAKGAGVVASRLGARCRPARPSLEIPARAVTQVEGPCSIAMCFGLMRCGLGGRVVEWWKCTECRSGGAPAQGQIEGRPRHLTDGLTHSSTNVGQPQSCRRHGPRMLPRSQSTAAVSALLALDDMEADIVP